MSGQTVKYLMDKFNLYLIPVEGMDVKTAFSLKIEKGEESLLCVTIPPKPSTKEILDILFREIILSEDLSPGQHSLMFSQEVREAAIREGRLKYEAILPQ